MVKTLRKTNKKGFTLVELVIVIAILAILAAVAIPTVSNVISTANKNVDAANAQTVELALKSAQAEATAGTWEGAPTGDDLTVGKALKFEGISALPEIKAGGAYRSKDGKITISSNTSSGVKFTESSTLSSVLNNSTDGTD
ncbi:prepilin-type N-terminal cleavage/methylation domain-containing protein [Caproiciproducens sp. R2]|uniref:prepilin-type N-terminal cleavage/methylation domain-containing protein n=1 Tax=Caproiciproducens sp. R2 TaxID=3435187 RepID=UPI004034195B